MLKRVTKTYQKIKQAKRLSQLLTLVSFFITFCFIRGITHLQKAHIIPNQNGGFHFHHMVPGIILLLISGYIGISFWNHNRMRLLVAILFGVGAALTLDEFALWLFLKDVYWAKQGRDSVDAVIIGILLLTFSFLLSEVHDHAWIKNIRKKF